MSDEQQPDAADVVLPDHIRLGIHGKAPPSYEEIMGAQTLSSMQTFVQDAPPLAYIDIMPRCTYPGNISRRIMPGYDSFSTVILTANKWLIDHPNYAVWKCEAVERDVKKDGVDLNSMCSHQSTYGYNVHVTGVRMWLTLRRELHLPPQQIALLNFLPQREEVTDNRFNKLYDRSKAGFVPPVFRYTYEGVTKSMERLNDMLRARPLPGIIINIDLCVVVAAEGYMEAYLNPETTCRCESGSSVWRRYTQVFRIFYLLGPPAMEQVCMELFVPTVLSPPTDVRRAKYQPFSALLRVAGKWLKAQTGIRVVNILSNPVKAEEFGDKKEVKISADTTDTFDLSMSTELMDRGVKADNQDLFDFSMGSEKIEVRAIRIFYVRGMTGPFSSIKLNTKLFVPARISRTKFETMSQTMFRIEAWLRLTGLPILSVETVCYLLKPCNAIGLDPEVVDTKTRHNASKDWVTAIRVYFATVFLEPPEDLLPPVSAPKKQSAACSVL